MIEKGESRLVDVRVEKRREERRRIRRWKKREEGMEMKQTESEQKVNRKGRGKERW